MSYFKVGDKVVRTESSEYLTKGNTYIVNSLHNSGNAITVNGFKELFASNFFKLYKDYKEEPKVKQFDINKDRWFIRVNGKAEWQAAVDLLNKKGLRFGGVGTEYTNEIVAIGKWPSELGNDLNGQRIGHTETVSYWTSQGYQEITLTYKTVIDTITLPVLAVEPEESDAQKQLKVLKEQIAELSKQADVLEGSL